MSLETVLINLGNANSNVKDSYWNLHYQLKRYDVMLSIPLIAISGLTSISAVTQLVGNILALQIITIVLSLLVTIIAGTQKYFEFDRRAAVAKQVAKRWGSVNGKVTFFSINLELIQDRTARVVILNSIFNEMDAIGGSLEDVPLTSESTEHMTNMRNVIDTAVRSL